MAIAFDAKTMQGWSGAGVTTYTASHTVGSGSDRFLVVAVTTANWTAGNPTNVTLTYAGASMTEVYKNIPIYSVANNWRSHFFYIPAPATGTNNVVVTTTGGSGLIRFVAASYTGVDQASPIIAQNFVNSTDTGSSITVSLTTGVAGWWIFGGAHVDGNVTGANNTATTREVTGASILADSNGNISPTTGNAGVTHAGSRGGGGTVIAIREAVNDLTVNTFDTLEITENHTESKTTFSSVFDTFSLTEDVTRLKVLSTSVFSTFALTENHSETKVHNVSSFDVFSLTENQSFLRNIFLETSDMFTLLDAITLQRVPGPSVQLPENRATGFSKRINMKRGGSM